jgi:hypothetical protein
MRPTWDRSSTPKARLQWYVLCPSTQGSSRGPARSICLAIGTCLANAHWTRSSHSPAVADQECGAWSSTINRKQRGILKNT